jgi:SAM-dependent methyltransferase
MSPKPDSWNSELYQSSHSFVWQYGRDLLVLLNAKPGERILDVGCGTGQLTAEITQFGAEVVGIDSSGGRRCFPDNCQSYFWRDCSASWKPNLGCQLCRKPTEFEYELSWEQISEFHARSTPTGDSCEL